jgi:hypothetical protein
LTYFPEKSASNWSQSVRNKVSFVAVPPRAHYTTVSSTDGSAPVGQHKY